MFKLIIAEDDFELSQLFSHVLIKNGFSVTCAENGQQALELINSDYYDLLISDVMMPVMDGFTLVKKLREYNKSIPVLMITAKDTFDDMREGFTSGTDDYMVKPINVNEMVLRINALLRRVKTQTERQLTIGGSVLDYDSFSITYDNKSIVIPQKEFMVLFKMASYPGKIFTKQQLLDDVWGYSTESDSHTVEVHIGRLRDRLKDNKDLSIVTMRGVGYKVIYNE
ncbi:MAG: response regulator transcription factor [Lachnospiraceae bacterium]|nr:response regulator transcription factor [Lachnospiraceae bacterium]